MINQTEIIQTLTPYLMAFPQNKMNEGSLLIYARALCSLSISEIDAAMLKLMRTCKFFPSVAEIFQAAESMKTTATNSETPSVDEAWREVIQQVHDAFVYREPVFSTPEIKRAALNMGWTTLCNLGINEMNTARAQFRDIYNGIISRSKEKKTNIAVLKSLPQQRVQELISSTSRKFKVLEGGGADEKRPQVAH